VIVRASYTIKLLEEDYTMSLKESLPRLPKEGGGEQAPKECPGSIFKMETKSLRGEYVTILEGDDTIEPRKPRGSTLAEAAKSVTKEREWSSMPILAAKRPRLLPPKSTS
jgi:hypothetical protein